MAEHDHYRIDPRALDAEVVAQASRTRAAGLAEAEARLKHSEAKAQLDVCRARLWLDVRNNPTKYHLPEGRPTEALVEAAVTMARDYQVAVNNLNQAKFALDIASAEVVAELDRRKMIERFIELVALDYHSEREPKPVSPAARERMDHLRRRGNRADIDVG